MDSNNATSGLNSPITTAESKASNSSSFNGVIKSQVSLETTKPAQSQETTRQIAISRNDLGFGFTLSRIFIKTKQSRVSKVKEN